MSVFLSSGSPTRSVAIRRLSRVQHLVGDGLLHQQPRARAADVALVEEDAVDDALDGLVERGVVEDDVGGLAAELEGDLLVVPATDLAIARPTSVEPVNATLSTSGCATSARPVSPAPVTMLTTPGGRSACWQISANSSAVSGVVSAGFSTTVLPQASAGRDLPGQHQQREVPRDDLAGDAERRGLAVAGVLQLVGPAGVVEEVRGDDRDVDVARLLDRLAVVDRLQDGELAAALLDDPGDPVEVLGALAARHPAPDAVVGPAGGLHGAVDVGLVGLGDLGQDLLGGGVDRLERCAVAVDELAVDEQAVRRLDVDDRARLGGRGVLERCRWPSAISPG